MANPLYETTRASLRELFSLRYGKSFDGNDDDLDECIDEVGGDVTILGAELLESMEAWQDGYEAATDDGHE